MGEAEFSSQDDAAAIHSSCGCTCWPFVLRSIPALLSIYTMRSSFACMIGAAGV